MTPGKGKQGDREWVHTEQDALENELFPSRVYPEVCFD